MHYGALTDIERETLEVLLRSPSLWCLQIVAGELGFDAAVAACQLRNAYPERLEERLHTVGYSADDLPPYAEARLLLAGVRIAVQRRFHPKDAFQSAARHAGLSLEEGRLALQTVLRYGGRSTISGERPGEIQDNERETARGYGS